MALDLNRFIGTRGVQSLPHFLVRESVLAAVELRKEQGKRDRMRLSRQVA